MYTLVKFCGIIYTEAYALFKKDTKFILKEYCNAEKREALDKK